MAGQGPGDSNPEAAVAPVIRRSGRLIGDVAVVQHRVARLTGQGLIVRLKFHHLGPSRYPDPGCAAILALAAARVGSKPWHHCCHTSRSSPASRHGIPSIPRLPRKRQWPQASMRTPRRRAATAPASTSGSPRRTKNSRRDTETGGPRRHRGEPSAPVHDSEKQHPCPRFKGGGELVDQGSRPQKHRHPAAPDKVEALLRQWIRSRSWRRLPAGPGPLRPRPRAPPVRGAPARNPAAVSHLREFQLTESGPAPDQAPFTCRQTALPQASWAEESRAACCCSALLFDGAVPST